VSHLAQGFIEVTGYVAAIEAADTMAKAADVVVKQVHKVDGPRVCVICEGDVAACQAAINAAVGVCAPHGTVISSNVIPHPAGGSEELYQHLDTINKAKAAKKKAKALAEAARREALKKSAKKNEK
jgi:microcompartment protein CcmL/EutN